MKTRVQRHTSYGITLDDEREFELSHEPADGLDPITRDMPDGRTVIGYLCQDTDCQNPLEDCDGMGRIYDARREFRQEHRRQYFDALGLDSDGNRIEGEKPNPYAVLLDVYSHGGDCYRVHGDGKYFPDEQWDVSNCCAVWVPEECCLEHIESSYKTAKARRKEAVKCAGQAVEEYNKYLSGDCWGVCVEVFDKEGEKIDDDFDSCWGFIGHEYAEQELKSNVAAVK